MDGAIMVETARELLDHLRLQTRAPELEALAAEAREQERHEDYRASLLEERRAASAALARARAMSPFSRERQGFEREGVEPPSGAERVRAAEQRLAAVNAELARFEER